MKKKLRRFLIGFVISAVTIIVLFATFIYFSVDNRVQIQSTLPSFLNHPTIFRLDSTRVNTDSVTAFIDRILTRAKVDGMAVSIVNQNQLVYQQYFGIKEKQKNKPFEPGTIFYGASFSKVIFSDIVLQLVDEQVIHLDSPLHKYLNKPLFEYKTNFIQQLGGSFIDYTDLKEDERYKEITARMCLSHTAGFPNWRWLEPDRKLKIKYDPGTRYSYSGEGMYLLQMVVEELTGKDLEEMAIEKIFTPLNMARSSYVWQRDYETNYCTGHNTNGNFLGIPKSNISNGAGSLSTTPEDFTRYWIKILGQHEKRYQQMITAQIRIKSKQQFGPNASVDTDENDSIQLSYGFGVGLYETPYGKAFFKEGHLEGWQHYAVGFPATGSALIMMSNSDNAEGTFKHLIEFCLGNPYTPLYWEHYIPFDQVMLSTSP